MIYTNQRRVLIHLHIPKNAGTTLGRMLRMKLGLWPPSSLLHHSIALGYYHVPGYEERLAQISKLSDRDRKRIRLFEAHAGYGMHEYLPQPSMYLTILREPIDRALSVYYYRLKGGNIPMDTSIEDFVLRINPQRVYWVDNAQVRYLAAEGGKIVDVPCGQCTRMMLETAMERLENSIAFVGLVEHFDASMVLLRRLLGWRNCFYVKSNINVRRKPKTDLTSQNLQLLNDHNQLDLELYRFALAMFEQQIRRLGPSFQAELDRYSAENDRYTRRMGRIQTFAPRVRKALTKIGWVGRVR